MRLPWALWAVQRRVVAHAVKSYYHQSGTKPVVAGFIELVATDIGQNPVSVRAVPGECLAPTEIVMADQRGDANDQNGDARRRASALAALQGNGAGDDAVPDGDAPEASERSGAASDAVAFAPGTEGARPGNKTGDVSAEARGVDEAEDALTSTPMAGGEGSATGFAAILAHGPGPDPDLPAKPPKANYNSKLAKPRPQERQSDALGFAARPNRYSEDIPEAREIRAPGTYTPPIPRGKRPKRAPDSYKILIPIMVTMGSLLFLIGLWALAVAMHMHVPLAPARHSATSNFDIDLNRALIAGLPLSVMLYVLAYFMARVVRRYHDQADAQNPPSRNQ